jgi:uncharacterized membrane protein
MTETRMDPGTTRWQVLDALRGLAIGMMIVFHLGWDLFYFGYYGVDVTTDPGWAVLQRATLGSFLLVAGVALPVAHRSGIRWNRFWRRFAVLVAGALLVTAGTYWMLPDYFVFFGVLHALALFSLVGLAFLRAPVAVIIFAGIVLCLLAFAYTDILFRERWLAWIGFWPYSPATADVVPIVPWLGVYLFGLASGRVLLDNGWDGWVARLKFRNAPARLLAAAGRRSLIIYLLHQPILIGLIMGYGMLANPAPPPLLP